MNYLNYLLTYLLQVVVKFIIITIMGRQKKKRTFNFSVNNVATVTLDNINSWSVDCPKNILATNSFSVNPDINAKVSLYKGDITKLKVDAIMNAANEALLGGLGIDKAIHKAGGTQLRKECEKFPEIRPGIRCDAGECKITKSYGKLPANYVFHTVGPRDQNNQKLKDCYESCLHNVLTYDGNNIKSIAFCCLATGIFGFDRSKAAEIALNTVRVWLECNHLSVDRVIFCTYETEDFDIYKDLMSSVYFPVCNNDLSDNTLEKTDDACFRGDYIEIIDDSESKNNED